MNTDNEVIYYEENIYFLLVTVSVFTFFQWNLNIKNIFKERYYA